MMSTKFLSGTATSNFRHNYPGYKITNDIAAFPYSSVMTVCYADGHAGDVSRRYVMSTPNEGPGIVESWLWRNIDIYAGKGY